MHEHHDHEHGCCSHSSQESNCCCLKGPRAHLLMKIFVILIIFLAGMCLGSLKSRHDNYRSFDKNFRGPGGCGMMRGYNYDNWGSGPVTPISELAPKASSTTTK